ncbi:MAG: phosphopantetheine-binding protein, partial [Ilumatobacteraceae bacterium]
ELGRAPADGSAAELLAHAEQREAHERELVIDDDIFAAIAQFVPEIGSIEVMLKDSRDDNEMTRFRYDVVLRRGPVVAAATTGELVIEQTTNGLDDVRSALATRPAVLRVRNVRDDRLVGDAAVLRRMADDPTTTVAALRAIGQAVDPGRRPGDFATLDPGYRATSSWSHGALDRFDVVLRDRTRPSFDPLPAVPRLPWTAYTNRPALLDNTDIGPQLRAHLRTTLPDYMVPSAFVVLEHLPRTPNGKTDRAALPAPDRGRREESGEAIAPSNDLERTISDIWQDILSLDAVGVETNLFDLGANSLMMVQASTRLSEALGRRLSLVEMFGHPTIRALAAHVGADGAGESRSAQQGQERAKARMDAMQRQRDARRAGRRG